MIDYNVCTQVDGKRARIRLQISAATFKEAFDEAFKMPYAAKGSNESMWVERVDPEYPDTIRDADDY